MMCTRRENILNGVLTFPVQIMEIMEPDMEKEEFINEFWDAIWNNFLREKSINSVFWLEKCNDEVFFNTLLLHLVKAGWIYSFVSDTSFACIELVKEKLMKWVSEEELSNIKFKYKFQKYRLHPVKSIMNDTVQINGKHKKTGLVRNGFMKAGNNSFKYDTDYINKYCKEIAQSIKKGLTNSTKDITYQEIIDELIGYYGVNNTSYTLNNCIIDSRGRSIFQCSKKVFNPVGCKDARALLIHSNHEKLTSSGYKAVYAAIAELMGYRGKTYEDKVHFGESCYITRELPSLKDMQYSNNYDDLHVRIWLERIYENLDTHDDTGWYVPIEIDAMASLIQLMGVLTNDYEYMKRTNLIETEEGFQDIWTVPYVSREHVKKALTPQLYGSGKNAKELWDANKLEYTIPQLNQISNDLTNGIFANANNFKNFIINNVKPKEKMFVNVNNEIFSIECNRFEWKKSVLKEYMIYASIGHFKRVVKRVDLVPDLEQFKRFFVTLLLHCLDSQIADYICKNVNWTIPNHDSFLIHPNDCNKVRKLYTERMYNIWNNRKKILKDYFTTIGITEVYPDKTDYVVKKFSPYCLK